MIFFIIFYTIFSYLFVIGVTTKTQLPAWNLLFAPLTFPMMLGRWFAHKF